MQEGIFKKNKKLAKPEESNSLEKPKTRRKVQLSFHLDQCLCDEKGAGWPLQQRGALLSVVGLIMIRLLQGGAVIKSFIA